MGAVPAHGAERASCKQLPNRGREGPAIEREPESTTVKLKKAY